MLKITHDELMSRIYKRIEDLKTNATAISRAATGKADLIRDMKRKNTFPSSQALMGLSKSLQCSYEFLTDATIEFIDASNEHKTISLNPARVVGWVQAGNWTEALQYPDDDMEQFYLPEIEKYSSVYGLHVRGDSMDRDYPPGTILVCVPLHNYTTGIVSGDHIIVRATCADGMIETTVKEYFRDDDATEWLIPKSFNPTHEKYPVPNGGAIDLLIKKKNIINIEMHAIVIASYKSRHQQ